MSELVKNEIDEIVANILEDYTDDRVINQVELFQQPDTERVIDILEKLLKIVYPGFFRDKSYRFYNINSRLTVLLEDVMYNMNKEIATALRQDPSRSGMSSEELESVAQQICFDFFKKIPKIRALVETDVKAAFDGDPAAYNYSEIILCYPGLLAITINRIAHELHLLKVPLIPRMMTEYAHSKTGIDIHPGATIGEYFFIDHGTGIVVGETLA